MARETRISLAIFAPVCLVAITLAGVHFTCSAASAETAVGAGFELRVSARRETFLQGEPVPIRVEITNRSDEEVEVIANLEPECLILRFRVTDPEGKTWIAEPLGVAEFEPETIRLNAGHKLLHTGLLLYGIVDGAQRFLFTDTGKYAVEALYDPEASGKPIISKPVTITIAPPHGADSEAQKLFMGREQGELAYFGQTYNPAALKKFWKVLQKYPTTRFAPYAAYYLGLHYVNERDYKQGITLLERVLTEYEDFPLKAELRYRLAGAYNESGRKAEAKKLLADLIAKEPSDLFARRAQRLLRELKFD